MRRLFDRCAGIDVGQALLVVCVRLVEPGGRVSEQVRLPTPTTPSSAMSRFGGVLRYIGGHPFRVQLCPVALPVRAARDVASVQLVALPVAE